MTSENKDEVGLLPVFTLVLWAFCLFVGSAGLLVQSGNPAPASQPTTLATEILDVQIADDIPPPDAMPPPPSRAELPQPFSLPAPSPAMAFALPVDAPLRTETAGVSAPVQLTFGQGEGRQPAPDYPIEAVMARQQGTVVVLFTVSEDGRVTSAAASSPSPWPMLNQAAIRTIRDSWRFPPGRARSYQVAIQFMLNP
jgi:periplasmic protein TonB